MPGRDVEQNESALILIAQVLALLLVFAVPVVVLLLVFPKHSSAIVLVSVYVLFGISALFAGVGWHEPTYSPIAKLYTKWIIVLTVLAMAVSRWQSYPDRLGVQWVTDVLIRAVILVAPFFLGRYVKNQIYNASAYSRK